MTGDGKMSEIKEINERLDRLLRYYGIEEKDLIKYEDIDATLSRMEEYYGIKNT